jgi:hypothetical protein
MFFYAIANKVKIFILEKKNPNFLLDTHFRIYLAPSLEPYLNMYISVCSMKIGYCSTAGVNTYAVQYCTNTLHNTYSCRKIIFIEGNAKCRHPKKTCKGTLRQLFICLMPRTLYPSPYTLYTCIQYTY